MTVDEVQAFKEFGYQLCAEIESAVARGVDPRREGEIAALDTLLPNGLVDGVRGYGSISYVLSPGIH